LGLFSSAKRSAIFFTADSVIVIGSILVFTSGAVY